MVKQLEDVSFVNDGMPQSLAPRKCFIECDMTVEPKKAALAQVTRRIACVRNQLRRRQCLKISSAWPERILKASILIVHLSEVACAAEFLRRHCYASSLEAAKSLFVDMFQQTPTEESVKISLSPPMHALVCAGRFIISWGLVLGPPLLNTSLELFILSLFPKNLVWWCVEKIRLE